MCRKMFYVLAVLCVCTTAGCSKEKTAEDPDRYGAEVSETDIPDKIGWDGGEYEIKVNYKLLTRSQPVQIVEPWSYRLFVEDDLIEENEVIDGATSVKITVPQNLSENSRKVTVEVLSSEVIGQEPVWKKVVDATQEAGLVDIGGVSWTLGNLMVDNEKFSIAGQPEYFGCYFKHYSDYAIPSENDSYAGVAYNPVGVTISLAEIPEKNADPCMLVSDKRLRMPTFSELEALNSYSSLTISDRNGVKGVEFDNGKLFLPCAGACNLIDGLIGQKNLSGFYWSSGYDAYGDGARLFFNEDICTVWFIDEAVTTVGNVRCVRNKPKASYVSHSSSTLTDNGACVVKIVTQAGSTTNYFVELVNLADRSSYFDELNNGRLEAEIELPKNNSLESKVFDIFIDSDPTGVQIIQPGKKDFAEYVSHTPQGMVSADEFKLTVTCESDLNAFDVEIKTPTEIIATKSGSKSNLVLEFTIPANEGPQRELQIWINGVNTNKKVVQEATKPKFSVIWSTGYLTVDNGVYSFAGQEEPGMFFKFKSRYGMTLNEAGTKYSGTAYGPASETKAYADVTYGDIDPCTLIADGKSWRMPTQAEFQELLGFEYTWKKDVYRAYSDGIQTVYITPSGSLNDTGTSVAQATWAKAWTTTPKDATKYIMLSGSFSSETASFIVTAGAAQNTAMMVRCVRNK